MAFGLGLFRNLLTRNNLQAPQAQIGEMARQPPRMARRAVQTQAGGGAIGGIGTPTPGSQPQDGMQMAADRPTPYRSPGSLAETTGVANNSPIRALPPTPTTPINIPFQDITGNLPVNPATRARIPMGNPPARLTQPFDLRAGLISGGSTTPKPSTPGYVDSPYADIITRAGEKYDIDPNLIAGVIGQESGGRANAVSPKDAQGLMQIIPSTQRQLGLKDPFDPEQNIDAGTRYLAQLTEQFGGNTDLALAAYNSGPGRVAGMLKRGVLDPNYVASGPLPQETRNYVPGVNKRRDAYASKAIMGQPHVDLANFDASQEELSRIAPSDVAIDNPVAKLSPDGYGDPYGYGRGSTTQGWLPRLGGEGPIAPTPEQMEMMRNREERNAMFTAMDERAAKRREERERLLGERPELRDARAIADREVAQKGIGWRLGQLGLGALKGFAGINANGGSGILGAISGAVGGGTGDLYRTNRINAIQGQYDQERQAYADKMRDFNTLDDNERQQEAVMNQMMRNDLLYKKQLGDLEIKRQKGELDQQEFEVYKQKVLEDQAIKRAGLDKEYVRLASVADNLRYSQEQMNKRNTENIEARRTEGQARRTFQQGENEKNRAAYANNQRQGSGSPKKLSVGEADRTAVKYAQELYDEEESALGISGRADTEIYGQDMSDPNSTPTSVGEVRRQLKRKYFGDKGKGKSATISIISGNLIAGTDPFDGISRPLSSTKATSTRPGVNK